MFNFNFGEILLVLIIILILFGPKRLPELAAALGKSVREFKKAMGAEPEKPKKKKKTRKKKAG